MCDCSKRAGLVRGAAFRAAELKAEQAQAISDGDEWTARLTQDDIQAAESLARLIHECDHQHSFCPYTGLQVCC